MGSSRQKIFHHLYFPLLLCEVWKQPLSEASFKAPVSSHEQGQLRLDEVQLLRLASLLEHGSRDEPEVLVTPLVKHEVRHVEMPPYVAVSKRLRKKCAGMARTSSVGRTSILPSREAVRVEATRGHIHRALNAYVIKDGYITLDGLTFDAERLYLWEKPCNPKNNTDVLLRQGFGNYDCLLQVLGLVRPTPEADGAWLKPRDLTAANILRVVAADPRAMYGLRSGFLFSTLQALSSFFRADTSCDPAQRQVSHHECLVAVQQMFSLNYAHWMESVLPKIVTTLTNGELQRAMEEWNCSYLLYRTKFENEYLRLLGVPDERVVEYKPCHLYHARRVIAFNPLPRDHMLFEEVTAVRSQLAWVFSPAPAEPRERSLVFDSRMSTTTAGGATTTRLTGRFLLTNVEEVRVALREEAQRVDLVFEEYLNFHDWPLTEAVLLFRRAREFVMLAGAGAFNMLHFSNPCVRVVEVQPEHHPYEGSGCGASNAMYLANMLRAPLVTVVVEGSMMEAISLPVKALHRALAKARRLDSHGCLPKEETTPEGASATSGEL